MGADGAEMDRRRSPEGPGWQKHGRVKVWGGESAIQSRKSKEHELLGKHALLGTGVDEVLDTSGELFKEPFFALDEHLEHLC